MIVIVLLLLTTLVLVLYKLSTRNFDYWKKNGVPYIEPTPLFGNFFDVFALRSTIGHFLAKCYNQFDTPYFGMFVLNTPCLIIKDLELIKAVLVKDFTFFSDHTIVCDENCDSIASNILFLSKNPKWKNMRTKVSPVFTSGKIKNMVTLMNEVAKDLKTYINNYNEQKSLEAKELCAKYSTDIIASCAFGIKANCFHNENAEFRTAGRTLFDFTVKNAFRQMSYFIAPGIVKHLKLPFFDTSVYAFMQNVFWDTINEREMGNYKRNDLVDLILEIRKKDSGDSEFVGDRIVAQAVQFYAAGFETVSSTLSFTLYELCIHPEIQAKLRREVKSSYSEHGEFNYETIHAMQYMHMVVCETLRKYPVLSFLDRMCLEDYKLPNSNLVIEKGTPIYIPMFGLHYDKAYFPNPDKYNPERFSEENRGGIPQFAYIPFGEGPRICIGARFGMMVVKLGLANILLEFELERSTDTPVPLVYETKSLFLASKTGLPLKFKKIVSKAA